MNFKKTIEAAAKNNAKPEPRKRKFQRNDLCPCMSGKKVKNCHKKLLR
jgi:uncharacterized protein YecA (UPF0149 family)